MKRWMVLFILCAGVESYAQVGLIQTAQPVQRDFTQVAPWFGKVVNRGRVDVMALESGCVESISVDDGQTVKQGDLLLVLNGKLVESRRTVLQHRIANLEERIRTAQKAVELKRAAAKQKLISYGELAQAESDAAKLESEKETTRQELAQLEAATQVCAPVSGIISARTATVGRQVQPGDSLLSILPATPPRIRATLFPPEGSVLKGKPVKMVLSAGKIVNGTVACELPERTAEGATTVWIETENSALHSGQTVAGQLILSSQRKALAVPPDAVVYDDAGQAYLFLKTGAGYEKRAVKTGLVSKDWIEIASGLSPSDAVVVQGAYELFHSNFSKIYKVVD